MREDWPFDQPPNAAAITTVAVLERRAPILVAQHYVDDHGWAFLCGTTNNEADGRVVGMGTALRLDESLRELADLPPGWRAERSSVGAPWRRRRDEAKREARSEGPDADFRTELSIAAAEARLMYDKGASPTDIIEALLAEYPLNVGTLQLVFMEAFGLSFQHAIPATNWWPDGSFGAPRDAVDKALRAAIEAKASAHGGRTR